jgi:hypothetical protein
MPILRTCIDFEAIEHLAISKSNDEMEKEFAKLKEVFQ